MQVANATVAAEFTEAGFRALAGQALHAVPPVEDMPGESGSLSGPSDFGLNPDLIQEFAGHPPPRPAAVLVPIITRPSLTVLLTQRTDSLSSHAGQIAFPGGKIESGEDPAAAALREAQEEIGLKPRYVDPLGYLDAYLTGTGFRILPLVALVRQGFELTLDPNEVADTFEVPLEFLMDARNHATHKRSWRGGERRFYAMPFEQRYIWGATAGIVKNMHQRLFPS